MWRTNVSTNLRIFSIAIINLADTLVVVVVDIMLMDFIRARGHDIDQVLHKMKMCKNIQLVDVMAGFSAMN